jgi:uncharacterized protein YcfL
MTSRVLASNALVALLLSLGCNTTNTYTSNGNGGYTSVVTNGWLAYKATVDNVREGKLDDGTMKVQIDVRSDQLNPQRFNYLFEWYDAQGMKIDSATATWQNRFIKPQETITLSAVAPTRTCSRWVLKLSDEKQPFTRSTSCTAPPSSFPPHSPCSLVARTRSTRIRRAPRSS